MSAANLRHSFRVHSVLLLCVCLFLFPFLWMLATSMKTDEELVAGRILPELQWFRATSPYVRDVDEPSKPADVSTQRWAEMLPQLRLLAQAAVAKRQANNGTDAQVHRRAAAELLVGNLVAQIDKQLWSGPDRALLDEFRARSTDENVNSSLSRSLASVQLLNFQLHTLDLHIHPLTRGGEFASKWRIESGNAQLIDGDDRTVLSYQFDSPVSEPIVMRCDFALPAGVEMNQVHKLILSLVADNSWHRVDATLDVQGQRWASDETKCLGQFRQLSLIYQPPTFDDQLLRPKIWTSLHRVGDAPAGELATIRIKLSPSSALRANWGKALRNFDRAFKAVPFWNYFFNSMVLVALCTIGSLFSASFVAYAFARLQWPGRSIAFMVLLATMMLPAQVTMIPSFIVWRSLHWYNTLNPLWVPAFLGSAFFIFLMTQHMRTIPLELEEAAKLDGLNPVQSFYYIILPNVKPTLAAIAILSFIGSWNEFMGPLIYLRDQTRFPLSLGLYGLNLMRTTDASQYPWTVVMAGNVMMTLPVIGVFFLFQRYFVQGMSLTGMKA